MGHKRSDRLLSEQKMGELFCDTCSGVDVCSGKCGDYEGVETICKAQDLKTAAAVNAEWATSMDKAMSDCMNHKCKLETKQCKYGGYSFGCFYCEWWQERKRSVGI
jgi:hypothetical protein